LRKTVFNSVPNNRAQITKRRMAIPLSCIDYPSPGNMRMSKNTCQ